METNNPKTLIYLEDAFSLLEHGRDCSSGSVDYEEGLTRAIQLVASLAPAEDLLSEELEGLPKNHRYTFDCKVDGTFVVFTSVSIAYEKEEGPVRVSVCWFGKTPLSAVLALKEKLNSKP